MCRLKKSIIARVQFFHFQLSTGSGITSGQVMSDKKTKKETHFQIDLLSVSIQTFGSGHF